MSAWSDVARSGETVECRPAGQTIRFLETADETSGDYVRVEITLAIDSTRENAVKHVHPQQEETLTVQTGTMGTDHDGTRDTLGPDESVTFGAGDAHAFWNAGTEELRIEVELRPAMQTDLFMRFAFGLSKVGWTTRSGIPLNPLRLGLLMDEFDSHLYLAGIPVPIQKLGARTLGPLARLCGYSLDLDDGYQRQGE
jgi:mannose-6-phosphate isomerase-like protein (cupin superfamily)